MNEATITIPNLNLLSAEKTMCEEALRRSEGNLVVAADLLGVTRHALRRRIIKHEIQWSRVVSSSARDVG